MTRDKPEPSVDDFARFENNVQNFFNYNNNSVIIKSALNRHYLFFKPEILSQSQLKFNIFCL